jgi:hypothetical protein
MSIYAWASKKVNVDVMAEDSEIINAKAVEVETFGFEFMNTMIDAFVESQRGILPGPWERCSLIVGLIGAGLGFLLGVLLKGDAAFWTAATGLAIELAGLGLSLVLMIKREWHTFRHAKRTFARDLDSGFSEYQNYVAKLRSYPMMERSKRLRYIRDRRRVMQHRLGLFSGGVERLGILPLLVALYLQFRNWEWGDWGMLADVKLVQGLLIWALVLTYVLGWHLVRLHARAESYELLLIEAEQQDAEASN